MKYFFCALFFLMGMDQLYAQNAGTVVLTGSVKNFNNQVEVQDMSELGDLSLPVAERFFVPDADGKFSMKFSLSSPNYFRLGRNILYLSPGDSLVLFVDYKNPKLATFSGKHSKENEYLRETPFPKGGSFLEAGTHVKNTIDSTVAVVAAMAEERAKSLKTFTGISKEFERLETARIKADVLNSFNSLYTYMPWHLKLSKDSTDAFHKQFPEMIAPYLDRYNKNFIDPSLLKLVVYRDVIDDLITPETKPSKEITQVRDWITARDLAQELKKTSDREGKLKFESKINSLSNAGYKKALATTLNQVLLLSNGDAAFDFTAMDQNNSGAPLSSFKGKLIYIDLWATWCGPCLEEMPAFEKLRDNFKDNPAIRFVSLSIDDDKDAWRRNMQKRNAAGYQWIIDRAKLQPYNIIGIPRAILVDQNFKIVEMNAGLPSSKTIVNTLNGLLK
jgi:thiol-disulfide isomerase/thioredoxin